MSSLSFLEKDVLGAHNSWVRGDISAKDREASIDKAVNRFLSKGSKAVGIYKK